MGDAIAEAVAIAVAAAVAAAVAMAVAVTVVVVAAAVAVAVVEGSFRQHGNMLGTCLPNEKTQLDRFTAARTRRGAPAGESR